MISNISSLSIRSWAALVSRICRRLQPFIPNHGLQITTSENQISNSESYLRRFIDQILELRRCYPEPNTVHDVILRAEIIGFDLRYSYTRGYDKIVAPVMPTLQSEKAMLLFSIAESFEIETTSQLFRNDSQELMLRFIKDAHLLLGEWYNLFMQVTSQEIEYLISLACVQSPLCMGTPIDVRRFSERIPLWGQSTPPWISEEWADYYSIIQQYPPTDRLSQYLSPPAENFVNERLLL